MGGQEGDEKGGKANGKGERRTHFIVPSVQRPEIDSAKEPVPSCLAQPLSNVLWPFFQPHSRKKKRERERG